MVQATPMQFLTDQGATTVRALSSLTRRDVAAVRASVRAAGGGFVVEEHDDYDGYMSLLLTPAQDGRPAYLVSGRTGAVDLAELHGDDMAALGTFAGIGAAMLALKPLLEGGARKPNAASRAERRVERHGPAADLHAAIGVDAAGPGAGGGWASILRAIDALNGRC